MSDKKDSGVLAEEKPSQSEHHSQKQASSSDSHAHKSEKSDHKKAEKKSESPKSSAKASEKSSKKKPSKKKEESKTPFHAYVAGITVILLLALLIFWLPTLFETQSVQDDLYATAEYQGETIYLANEEVQKYVTIAEVEGFGLTEQQIAEQLLNLNILLAEANKQGITVNDAHIQAQLAEFDVLISQQLSDEQFVSALAERGFTKDEFIAELRESLAKDLAIQELINQQVISQNPATDEELQNLYTAYADSFSAPESIAAKHILICHVDSERCESQRSKGEAEAFSKAVLADIIAGDITFEEAAVQYSDGPSGPNGGDLGTFARGVMVPEFETVAFGMDPGDVTAQPVETIFGYHIIYVYEKVDASQRSFEEVRAQLEELYVRQVLATKQQEYIESILSQATISYESEE